MSAGPGVLLLASLAVVLPGVALGAGLAAGAPWLVHLALGLCVGFGFLAGMLFPRFRAVEGGMVPFSLFLAAVVFAVVEAYAVGTGIARGAPPMAAALLLPPVAIAGGSLWVAARRRHDFGTAVGRPE